MHQSFWIPVQSCSNIELSLCVSDGGVSRAAEVKDMRVREIPRDKRGLRCQDSTDGRWTGHIRSSTVSSQGQCTLFMFSSNFKQSCWQCELFSRVMVRRVQVLHNRAESLKKAIAQRELVASWTGAGLWGSCCFYLRDSFFFFFLK